MSYFDDASLVFIPSGTKTSKAYSVKPIDGTGDLTFSRSNDTATRVNSAGLIERVRTNLLTYSNDFSNAAWTKTNVTLTTGQTDPNGGSTATTVDATNGASAFVRQNISITSGIKYAWSVYIKGSTTGQSIAIYTDGASNIYEIKALTTSWQRFTGVATAASSGSSGFYILCGSGYSGLTDLPFDIAFGQVEASDIATDYIATTSAAVSVGPVANVPRLDYLNSSCPRLLLEPQSVNKCPSSSSYGTNNINISVSRNVAAAPTGYNEADLLQDDNTLGEHLFGQNFDSITNGLAYTISCFFKANGSGGRAVIRYYGGTWVYAVYNLANGTVAATDGSITASVQNYGNGWYRCILTHTAVSDYTPMVTQIGVANSSNQFSYQGASSLGFYFWGFQAEQKSYPTSIIPTLGAAVTRGADDFTKTGISSLIGQTEGTLFVDFIPANTPVSGVQQWLFFLGSGGTYIGFLITSGGKLRGNVANTTDQALIDTSYNLVSGTTYKAALAYKQDDFALYVNGVQIGLDTSGTVPAVSSLRANYNTTAANMVNAKYNQALLFKTRLTNAQLAELTSL